VRWFVANAAERFGGRLTTTGRAEVYRLATGALAPLLKDRGALLDRQEVVFDRLDDPTAGYLGRTHPLVAAYCDTVLGAAFAPECSNNTHAIARCGAIFTDAVRTRTGVALLRVRYLLREKGHDGFAEEIALVAFERGAAGPRLLTPFDDTARHLLSAARPVANMGKGEATEQVEQMLSLLRDESTWYAPIIAARMEALQAAHDRLRRLTRDAKLTIIPHTPPDLLGCYVLVPAGGSR
jgi:hypothetical protein